MEDFRTLFQIPAANMPKFEEQIAKLSKKSVKLIGSEIRPFTFSHEDRKLSDGLTHRVYTVMLTAELPVLNGWTFVARLDHSNDTGTIVRMVPNAGELPAQYRNTTATTCDHCGHKRYRRDTFVVRHDETNEFKQVGSTCLKDFFGHDPYKIAKLAELLGYAYECGKGGEHYVGGDMRWTDVEEFCGYAAMAVRLNGWVSAKAAYANSFLTSTKVTATELMLSGKKLEDADKALAIASLEWATSLREKATLSDYEHNINVVASATMIEYRSTGLAASIVGVFFNNQQKAANASVEKTVDVGNFEGVISLFNAGSKKLKHPKIHLALDNGQVIVLAVAGANSNAPGTVNITDGRPFGQNIWFGRVTPDGVWDRSRGFANKAVPQAGDTMTSLTALLASLAANPAATAAKHGKMTGNCCFCNMSLTDARSTAVGYGKTCAKNYSLVWGE